MKTEDSLADALADLAYDPDDDDLWHMAHTDCQLDRETVRTICGREVPWASMLEGDGPPPCEPCWRPVVECPICGSLFRNVEP